MRSRKRFDGALAFVRWMLAAPLLRFSLLLRSRSRWLFVGVAAVAAVALIAYRTWVELGPEVLRGDLYQVHADDIVVTDQPPWIAAATDVRAEVVRDASLDSPMSLVDGRLTERISKAFAMHPWVQRVETVSKRFPASVEVKLVWREPVCMVEVDGRLEPVDVHGVLLPSGDISSNSARGYPKLTGINTIPIGPVGTHWGDPRVTGAAQIAASLRQSWSNLGLSHIVASGSPVEGPSGFDYTFDLFTHRGTPVHWGFAPGAAMAGEPSAADKVARLKNHLADFGTLERGSGQLQWNLRARHRISSRPVDLPR